MTTRRIWTTCGLLLLLTVTASAQPTGGEANEDQADDQTVREQTIYVPYSKLRDVFEQKGRGVFLPYEEFQKLWKQARLWPGASI